MARHDVLPVTPWAARPERSQTLYNLARVRCGAQGLAGAPNKVEPLLFSVEAVQEQLCRPIGNGPVLERVIIPDRASHVPNPERGGSPPAPSPSSDCRRRSHPETAEFSCAECGQGLPEECRLDHPERPTPRGSGRPEAQAAREAVVSLEAAACKLRSDGKPLPAKRRRVCP